MNIGIEAYIANVLHNRHTAHTTGVCTCCITSLRRICACRYRATECSRVSLQPTSADSVSISIRLVHTHMCILFSYSVGELAFHTVGECQKLSWAAKTTISLCICVYRRRMIIHTRQSMRSAVKLKLTTSKSCCRV